MNHSVRIVAFTAALLCLSAVTLAALGSHVINMRGLQGIWQTASIIHFFNAAALMGLAALLTQQNSRHLWWGAWLIGLGTVVFCGSIYLHVMTGHTLAGVAPTGGLLMMLGWLLVTLSFLRKS